MSTQIFTSQYPLPLESGKELPTFKLAWKSWGSLNADKSNVVWICHALTGNADTADWWPGLIGENALFDPKKYFIICANVIGSCYGSTYALSENTETGHPYYHDFPFLSIRDMVQALIALRKHLEIEQIHMILGGSLGGQQVLEWAVMEPEIFEFCVPIATNAFHSPWGIAFNEAQRMAIEADGSWLKKEKTAGLAGMKAARAAAMISYRNYEVYNQSQHELNQEVRDNFKASSYQRYQGEKLASRFDAFAYWTLSKAMDSHHLGRGRGSAELALGKIQAKTLVLGIDSDVLFPPSEQRFIAEHIPGAELEVISSPYGHDGFLIEGKKISEQISVFQKAKAENLFIQ